MHTIKQVAAAIDRTTGRRQKTHDPIERVVRELAPQQPGDVGLSHAHHLGSLGLAPSFAIDDVLELAHQLGFDEMIFRVGEAEIGKDVPAATSYAGTTDAWHSMSPST